MSDIGKCLCGNMCDYMFDMECSECRNKREVDRHKKTLHKITKVLIDKDTTISNDKYRAKKKK